MVKTLPFNYPLTKESSYPVKLSVVIPVYNEEENLQILIEELTEVLQRINMDYEVILVDDGSLDRSFQVLKELAKKDSHLTVIRFRKNSGQTAAFDAGFKMARGEIIVTLDSDLQNDPWDIPLLLENMKDYDMVCGVRIRRADSWIKLISSRIANYVRNKLSEEEITDTGCSLKAYKSEYLKRLKLFNGMHRFFPTLMKMEGAKVKEIPVHHRQRRFGKSKYNIRNRIFRSFIDLLAVRWMKKRKLSYEIEEVFTGQGSDQKERRPVTLHYEILDPLDRL